MLHYGAGIASLQGKDAKLQSTRFVILSEAKNPEGNSRKDAKVQRIMNKD